MEQSAVDSVSQPQLVKEPTWLRILEISIGAISIILSGYVLAQPGLAIFTAVKILSIVLLFVGIQSTVVGTFSRYVRTSSRFSNITLGASAIAFSILVATLLPPPPILFSIFLAGFTLLFNGIGGIMQSYRYDLEMVYYSSGVESHGYQSLKAFPERLEGKAGRLINSYLMIIG